MDPDTNNTAELTVVIDSEALELEGSIKADGRNAGTIEHDSASGISTVQYIDGSFEFLTF